MTSDASVCGGWLSHRAAPINNVAARPMPMLRARDRMSAGACHFEVWRSRPKRVGVSENACGCRKPRTADIANARCKRTSSSSIRCRNSGQSLQRCRCSSSSTDSVCGSPPINSRARSQITSHLSGIDCRTADEGFGHASFPSSSAQAVAADWTNAAATSWHQQRPQPRRQANRTSRWPHQYPFLNRPGQTSHNYTSAVHTSSSVG